MGVGVGGQGRRQGSGEGCWGSKRGWMPPMTPPMELTASESCIATARPTLSVSSERLATSPEGRLSLTKPSSCASTARKSSRLRRRLVRSPAVMRKSEARTRSVACSCTAPSTEATPRIVSAPDEAALISTAERAGRDTAMATAPSVQTAPASRRPRSSSGSRKRSQPPSSVAAAFALAGVVGLSGLAPADPLAS